MTIANYINHFWIDLDASSSMKSFESTVVQVVDELIADMARKSTEVEQETRITINTFATHGQRKNLVWDKDVLRMPSIAGLYKAYGWTAMVEGVCLSVDDMLTIPTQYGDHAFVGYVVTDGEENDSRDKYALKAKTPNLGNNWTLAALVPDENGKHKAAMYGFPANNIQVWKAGSVKGIQDVIRQIQVSSSNFMDARKTGVRGTTSLFQLQTVTAADIRTNLKPMHPDEYALVRVPQDSRIDEFVTGRIRQGNRPVAYEPIAGRGYYQMTKRELIQGYKKIAVTYGNRVYTGDAARSMLGLPNEDVKVSPGAHPGYDIFVQSTAPNRKLLEGTTFLYIY